MHRHAGFKLALLLLLACISWQCSKDDQQLEVIPCYEKSQFLLTYDGNTEVFFVNSAVAQSYELGDEHRITVVMTNYIMAAENIYDDPALPGQKKLEVTFRASASQALQANHAYPFADHREETYVSAQIKDYRDAQTLWFEPSGQAMISRLGREFICGSFHFQGRNSPGMSTPMMTVQGEYSAKLSD